MFPYFQDCREDCLTHSRFHLMSRVLDTQSQTHMRADEDIRLLNHCNDILLPMKIQRRELMIDGQD